MFDRFSVNFGDIMFKKYGDGKITNVFDAEELTEEQKKASKDLAKKSKTNEDNSSEKKSGS